MPRAWPMLQDLEGPGSVEGKAEVWLGETVNVINM